MALGSKITRPKKYFPDIVNEAFPLSGPSRILGRGGGAGDMAAHEFGFLG